MRAATKITVLLGSIALAITGCSSAPADPRAAMESNAAILDTAAQDVMDAALAAGFDDVSAHGRVHSCQSEPAPGVSYVAGVRVHIGEDLQGAFDAMAARLTSSGWADTGKPLGGTSPSGRFTRDKVTLDVKTGGFSYAGEVRGADEMTLGLTIADGCVRIARSASALDFEDLAKDIPRAR